MYRKNISIYIEKLILQLKNLKVEKIIIDLKRTIHFNSIGKVSLIDIKIDIEIKYTYLLY